MQQDQGQEASRLKTSNFSTSKRGSIETDTFFLIESVSIFLEKFLEIMEEPLKNYYKSEWNKFKELLTSPEMEAYKCFSYSNGLKLTKPQPIIPVATFNLTDLDQRNLLSISHIQTIVPLNPLTLLGNTSNLITNISLKASTVNMVANTVGGSIQPEQNIQLGSKCGENLIGGGGQNTTTKVLSLSKHNLKSSTDRRTSDHDAMLKSSKNSLQSLYNKLNIQAHSLSNLGCGNSNPNMSMNEENLNGVFNLTQNGVRISSNSGSISLNQGNGNTNINPITTNTNTKPKSNGNIGAGVQKILNHSISSYIQTDSVKFQAKVQGTVNNNYMIDERKKSTGNNWVIEERTRSPGISSVNYGHISIPKNQQYKMQTQKVRSIHQAPSILNSNSNSSSKKSTEKYNTHNVSSFTLGKQPNYNTHVKAQKSLQIDIASRNFHQITGHSSARGDLHSSKSGTSSNTIHLGGNSKHPLNCTSTYPSSNGGSFNNSRTTLNNKNTYFPTQPNSISQNNNMNNLNSVNRLYTKTEGSTERDSAQIEYKGNDSILFENHELHFMQSQQQDQGKQQYPVQSTMPSIQPSLFTSGEQSVENKTEVQLDSSDSKPIRKKVRRETRKLSLEKFQSNIDAIEQDSESDNRENQKEGSGEKKELLKIIMNHLDSRNGVSNKKKDKKEDQNKQRRASPVNKRVGCAGIQQMHDLEKFKVEEKVENPYKHLIKIVKQRLDIFRMDTMTIELVANKFTDIETKRRAECIIDEPNENCDFQQRVEIKRDNLKKYSVFAKKGIGQNSKKVDESIFNQLKSTKEKDNKKKLII